MGVLLEGEGWVIVATPLTYHLDRDASAQSDRGVRMAKVVQSDSRVSRPPNSDLEFLAEEIGMDGRPILSAENQPCLPVFGDPLR